MNKLILHLNKNKGYTWINKDKVHFRGICHNKSIDELLSDLSQCVNETQVIEIVKTLCGSFSIVVEMEYTTFVIVDHLRSIPLFYEISDNDLIVYDSLDTSNTVNKAINASMVQIYKKAHFVFGENTIIDNVFQVPAGSYLIFENTTGKVRLEEYWRFEYDIQLSNNQNAIEQLRMVYDQVFSSVVNSLDGKTAVVPLSGGHDSRLVAYYLKKHGCKNIIAFSYGEKENLESSIGNQVADFLKIPFYFVRYDRERVNKYRAIESSYMKYSGDLSSTISIQDIMAVDYLSEKRIIPKESVIVPGLGGVLTGHYISESFLKADSVEINKLIDFIRNEYFGSFTNGEDNLFELVTNQIYNFINRESDGTLDGKNTISGVMANELFEKYTYYEEQAKFIANAVRAYEYYGYSWITPLFDQRVFNIWRRIDTQLRFGDKVFKEMEKQEFPEELLAIKFTGSKEMRHFYEGSKISSFELFKTRFKRYLLPRKTHYLNKFIPLRVYYQLLFFERRCSIADAVASIYVSKLK